MRVLIFGDSITQGYWDTDGGWVEKLRKHYDLLQVADLDGSDEPTVFNVGVSADNSKNVLDRIAFETKARTRGSTLPIVVVQIGINDASTDSVPDNESVSLPIEQYEQNLRAIAEAVTPLSSKLIFVGLSACDETRTTPVSWGDFYYTNAAIKSYEATMKDVSAELHIPFLPVFDTFKTELEHGKPLLPDGLHPNNEGHAVLYKIIAKQLIPLLVY